jgi:hypothetical protein
MMSSWSWMAEAVMVPLLGATLAMAVRLDRALRVVRRDRAAFEALISNLGSATGAVKMGIQALRDEAERASETIERRSEDADRMATDLSFLIEAAERVCGRLEQQVQPGTDAPVEAPAMAPAPKRRRSRAAAPAAVVAPPAAAPARATRSRARKLVAAAQ